VAEPILVVDQVRKRYTRGLVNRQVTFSLAADFTIAEPGIVGVMGPNGSGKTTLFELITGSNLPSSGRVLCQGRDIHQVRYHERDRLAIHYHQSYQVRHFKRTKPSFMLEPAGSDYPMVHLFDEPQFNTQDGYIGFMLDFFRKLKDEGRLVFLCLHPTERYHLEIMQEICENYLFVFEGEVTKAPDLEALCQNERVQTYLGRTLAQERK
jgi:ABC-type branched-subunit amino acid transport system ATPase component